MSTLVKSLMFASLALPFLVGCNEPMESISQVTKFRVMGIRAEPPEVAPGDAPSMEVLFADPRGEGREVTILWLNCVGGLSMESSVSEGCEPLWNPQLQTASEGGHQYHLIQSPMDILDGLPEDQQSLTITIIAILCAGGDLNLEGADLGGAITSLDELCQGGDGLVAMKSFSISNSETPNQNPRIDKFFFEDLEDGAELTAEQDVYPDEGEVPSTGLYECVDSQGCREGTTIAAYLTEESFEVYDKVTFGEVSPAVEDPYISWFVAGIDPQVMTGQFSDDRTRIIVPENPSSLPDWNPDPFEVNWSPPRDGGLFRIWAVVHDTRGGINWKSYLVEAVVPSG